MISRNYQISNFIVVRNNVPLFVTNILSGNWQWRKASSINCPKRCCVITKYAYSKQFLRPPPPPHPSNFIAGRPKAALLVWLFGDFRCGVSLFIVILVYINIKIGKNRC